MDNRHALTKTALEKGRESACVPERDFQLTPLHIDPIWPMQRRPLKKIKSLRSMIRSRMILFKFLHAVSPRTIELRPFFPEEEEDEEDIWLMGGNVLTLIEKTSEEKQKKLQRLREIQSEAYANGRHNRRLTERRIDFDLPLCMQSYRVDTCQELVLSRRKDCESTFHRIPRLVLSENRSNKHLNERSVNGFERGERNCSRFTAGGVTSKH